MAFEWWMTVVGLALLFDFFNGVNDAANSVATIVATRVLTPVSAVALAAVMNLAGPFLFGTAVAKAVGSGLVDVNILTTNVLAAAVLGGIFATALATAFGLPISVSHSLVGGLLGAGFAAAGVGALLLPTAGSLLVAGEWIVGGFVAGGLLGVVGGSLSGSEQLRIPGFVAGAVGATLALVYGIATGAVALNKLGATLIFIVFSPFIGFLGAFALGTIIIWIFGGADSRKANWWFRKLQLLSVSAFSLSHGTNDAQKTMGIIAALLFANGVIDTFFIPTWVIIAAAVAIALGTFIGGWRVVETVGHRLTKLEPYQGFSAETAGASVLFWMASLGVPVSTTHAITGSIMGVGATRRLTAVRWNVARHIMGAWVLTIPVAGAVAWIVYEGIIYVL